MKIEITFRLSPESRDEMIAKFGGEYRAFREYVEKLQADGIFPRDVPIRGLLVTGRWD